MLKTKKTILLGFILLIAGLANAQIVDHYGLRIGAGLSNQYWDYESDVFSNISGGWKDYKSGFIGQVYAEKNIGEYLSFRPAVGYIQKGFVDEAELITAEGEELGKKEYSIVFHDLSMDLSLKLTLFDKQFKPYILLGLRGDYLLDYRSVVNIQGEEHEKNVSPYDDFNKFNLGALFGFGISYKELLFLDFEFNPAITKNFDNSEVSVKDRYYGLTIGLNVNTLTKKDE